MTQASHGLSTTAELLVKLKNHGPLLPIFIMGGAVAKQ